MSDGFASRSRRRRPRPSLQSLIWLPALRRWLNRLRAGRLAVRLPSGAKVAGEGAEAGPRASLHIHEWRALRRVAISGDIGFAEGYVAGDWTSGDLVSLLRLCARNAAHLGATAAGGSAWHQIYNRWRHRARQNSPRNSARNIISHYDLGNAFFAGWLDSQMLYSSALWDETTSDLEQAQTRKLDRIVETLALSGGEDVLEIGCGWGALAARLARAGRVVGVTLSPAQLGHARARLAADGLVADLRLQDYRALDGAYDRVVSVEMIEAVGEAYWPLYFGKIAQSLKSGGKALIQAITLDESRFDAYRATPDFIQRHIFPGGFLPTPSAMRAQAEAVGLRLVGVETFGLSYARTLAEWRRRFEACWREIAPLGFDERFRRLWTYYLCYCEAGFLEQITDVGLYLYEKAEPAA